MFPLGPVSRFFMLALGGRFDVRLDRIIGPTHQSVAFVHRRQWLRPVSSRVSLRRSRVCFPSGLGLSRTSGWSSSPLCDDGAGPAPEPGPRSCFITWFVVALRLAPLGAGPRCALLVAAPCPLSASPPTWSACCSSGGSSASCSPRPRSGCSSGVISTSSPKAPLTSIQFQDVRQNPVEQLLQCGTLHFDTAAQSDKPLSRFMEGHPDPSRWARRFTSSGFKPARPDHPERRLGCRWNEFAGGWLFSS